MPLKNQYRYNCQKVNWGNMQQLIPLGYVEVVPGETIQGKVSVRVHSAPTDRNVDTRTYLDVYGFYMANRLAWSDWPTFISEVSNSVGTVPTVTDLFVQNFEPRHTIGPAQAPATQHVCFQRRMYNKVFQHFFAQSDKVVVNEDGNVIHKVLQRPSTFEYAEPVDEATDTNVNVVANQFTVDELRDALGRDQFKKMRAFYGERYVDYLASLGVSIPWTIQDYPKTIGKKHTDWAYRSVANTTAPDGTANTQFVGEQQGYFDSKAILDCRKTFIPEHGLLGFYAVLRADPTYDESPIGAHQRKDSRQLYWSPEFDGIKERMWTTQLLIDDPVNGGEDTVQRPNWEEHRKGLNENTEWGDPQASGERMAFVQPDATDPVLDPTNYDAMFDQTYFGNNAIAQFTAEYRLRRYSPIMRQGQQKPLF